MAGDRKTKHIFVTGGVLSSLGKGLASASIGALLEARGLRVTFLKLDPYLNVDPGTMNPLQHGEVYVTSDGAETDLDLGHYERFTRAKMGKANNATAGRIYDAVRLSYVNAWHPEALLLRSGGGVEGLGEGGLPVGSHEDAVYEVGQADGRPGDRLIAFSDGALDVAVDTSGPLEPAELVEPARAAGPGAPALLDALQAFVRSRERGEPEDDITILVCDFA